MESLLQDIRYAFRTLLRRPGFAAVSVIALAVGIGANTAIFSMIDGLLLRPLPFKDLDRLVMVWGKQGQSDERNEISPADFLDFKDQNRVFDHLAAYQWWDVNLTGQGEPDRVQGFLVTASFFTALGVEPARGRAFLEEEEQVGHELVVVLSHALWQRRFASDPNVVGQTISLDGRGYTVVGVMPEDFDWPTSVELWSPLAMTDKEKSLRGSHYLRALGRIKAGLEIGQAQAEMNVIAARLAEQYPQTNANRGTNLIRLPGQFSDDLMRSFLLVIMGAVAFVLLIACANVANLQLARATARQKEIAIRSALGARRGRIVRQLLTESVLLSLSGALLGLLLALWGVDLIKTSIPLDQARYITGLKQMSLNLRGFGFTLTVALLTGIISGLAPSLQASKPDLNEALKEGGRTSASGGSGRLRGLLVVCEIALAMILLVGTGLMVRGFTNILKSQKQGFDSTGLLTAKVTLPELKYAEPRQRTAFFKQVLERLETVAGVEAAGAVSNLPSSGNWNTANFSIEGRAPATPGERLVTNYQVIDPDYFQAMRIPLRSGRGFTRQDDLETMPVAIISESLARRYWPDQDPVGKRVKVDSRPDPKWTTVVGVAGDVKQFMFDRAPRPTIYVPYLQAPRYTMTLIVRASADSMSLVSAVRSEVQAVDKDQPIYDVGTMEEVISNHTSGVRISAALMAIFGAIALILAAVGVYSVMSYSVTQRTHEIGVRMSLGAQTGDVLRLIVGHAFKLAVAGLAIGLLPAIALMRLMASLLGGIVSLDLLTIALFTLLLAAVALLSSYIPARKAARIDPMVALRYE